MSIREKAKQLYSKKAIVGWLALIKAIWGWIGSISTIEFAGKYMSVIWDFLSSSAGNLVLLAVGFSLVLWAVFKPTKQKPGNIDNKSVPLESLNLANRDIDKLKEFRTSQLQSVRYSNSTLISSRLESIQFHGLKNLEPFIVIQLTFTNCSIFKLKLEDVKFTAWLNQNSLSLPSSSMSVPKQVHYGSTTLLQFKQPVTAVTADFLKNTIEKHDKIMWKFQLEASYIIEDTGDRCPVIHLLERTEIPFWP